MSKLTVLCGPPGSGKSTLARKLMLKNPSTTVIVNRDDIRSMLGVYWVPSREILVTDIESDMIDAALERGYNVIVDATNLREKQGGMYKILAETALVDYELIELEVPLWKAVWRDAKRGLFGGRYVGYKVIKGFYDRYKL